MNFTSGADVSELLSLDHIRNQLIRLEDTIIFRKAQFAYNKKIYQAGEFKDELQYDGSWLEWFLFEIESFHDSPDEHAFTSLDKLPRPIIKPQSLPSLLHQPAAKHPSVNVNSRILDFYVGHIVPGITSSVPNTLEDDGNYGSAATRDVEVLQALSRRIHFGTSLHFYLADLLGMFVSESKFLSAPHDFIPHILNPNPDALAGLITKPAVEAKLLIRLANKARVYGCEMDADGKVVELPDEEMASRGKIDLAAVVGMYRDWVDYLLHRLDTVPQSQIDEWMAKN
ncbi:chorismate mutase [Kwoniella shivajii]|uniref:chorismate mutase n=1 Tax=Kwoniella shivajii TaxID=564305 RepID=A0ABZ1D9N6_9TREE|nr:chorismate mutase [Kwoniella shivajii]